MRNGHCRSSSLILLFLSILLFTNQFSLMLAQDKDWTKEQLIGGPASPSKKGRGVDQDPMLWGFPGHLTPEEADTYFQFKAEVEKRGGDFRDTIFCFGEEEGEVWAFCRWLRARKYVLADVITMVEQATETRAEAKKFDFYPDPKDALGVDKSLFFAQYPQLYSGFAKIGAPLFISKPGILNVDGIECLTTLDGIIKFHWYIMMHDFANRLRNQKAKDPNFHRFDCVCVLDLNNLTTAQLSRRALAIIKEQSAIDSVCFPETMNKMLIINAPTFFAATWRLIRGWLDPRTAAKIEVISSTAASHKRLLELVDEDQLPSDYGGKGEDTRVTLANQYEGEADRLETKMLYLRGHGSETIDIKAGETCEISVFTRSTAGALFTLTDADAKTHFLDNVEAKHTGNGDVDSERPTCIVLNEGSDKRVAGPVKLKIKADSHASRFSTHNFLLVFAFHKK